MPPEKKLLPCSFRARKCEAFQRKLRGGVAVPGELAPPATSLFDKLMPASASGSRHVVFTKPVRQPFTLPSTRPLVKYFCRKG